MLRSVLLASTLLLVACGDSTEPLATARPGVVFTFPIEGQNDVPVGSRIVVTVSDKVTAAARKCDKALGRLVTDIPSGLDCAARGFDFLAWQGDVWALQNAVRAGIEELKTGIAAQGRSRA